MLLNRENMKISETKDSILKDIIIASILKVFTLSGVARGYDSEQLQTDIGLISDELISDFRRERVFYSLRSVEIGYCFLCGLRGDFDAFIKTYGVNYQSFYKWLSYYADSEMRQEAVNNIVKEANEGVRLIEAKTEITEAEKEKIIREGINESYREYKRGARGTIINCDIPDWGGVKERYLRGLGLLNGMDLKAFYDKNIEEKKENVF